jgi:hypothetical protein
MELLAFPVIAIRRRLPMATIASGTPVVYTRSSTCPALLQRQMRNSLATQRPPSRVGDSRNPPENLAKSSNLSVRWPEFTGKTTSGPWFLCESRRGMSIHRPCATGPDCRIQLLYQVATTGSASEPPHRGRHAPNCISTREISMPTGSDDPCAAASGNSIRSQRAFQSRGGSPTYCTGCQYP